LGQEIRPSGVGDFPIFERNLGDLRCECELGGVNVCLNSTTRETESGNDQQDREELLRPMASRCPGDSALTCAPQKSVIFEKTIFGIALCEGGVTEIENLRFSRCPDMRRVLERLTKDVPRVI
jgi:hypothetical protein